MATETQCLKMDEIYDSLRGQYCPDDSGRKVKRPIFIPRKIYTLEKCVSKFRLHVELKISRYMLMRANMLGWVNWIIVDKSVSLLKTLT